MNLKNKINQRFISALLILAILAPTILLPKPKKANAIFATEPTQIANGVLLGAINVSAATTAGQTTGTTIFKGKEWVFHLLQQIGKAFARRLLAQMTQSTINWINSGFHGAPLFVESPESFFKDIAKYEIKNLINTIGYDNNRFPFGKSFAINVINSYKRTFENNAEYTLSKVINDPALLQAYRTDFNTGGWDGFLINTQYPQNNYMGSTLLSSNQLAEKLQGTTDNNATKIQKTLQQGLGFLSPQKCETNPKYNNLKNQFQQPKFKPSCTVPENPCTLDSDGTQQSFLQCLSDWEYLKGACERKNEEDRAKWADTNACPAKKDGSSGFVTTTPGSVVANQITGALGSGRVATELATALGNPLSAIFDALLNKLLSSGLTALTTKKNPPAPVDDFDYFGQTLGSPASAGSVGTGGGSGSGSTGGELDFGGPDQEIILANLKQNVQNLINNANTELKTIDNSDPTSLGIIQLSDKIFPKAQELDMCLPGPNIRFEERLNQEALRAGAELQAATADLDPVKTAVATEANIELTSAVNSFKDWLKNTINTELPSAGVYANAVNSVKEISGDLSELSTRRNTINETLIKLQSIKTSLDAITVQPPRGSAEESTMVRLKQRLDGMLIDLSTSSTINEMQNKRDDAKDKLTSLESLITRCASERTAKGWSTPGGEASTKGANTEKALFCDLPIKGGYTHKTFVNTGVVTHPQIPLVNANNVYLGINISISCAAIYKTSITDYKQSVQGGF